MSTQFAVDLLDATIEVLRPQLDATARAARNYSASDIVQSEFMQFARETGLISDLGRHGEEDAQHLLNWARALNPFEHGPLR